MDPESTTQFDLTLTYFQVGKRFFLIFGFLYVLFLARLSSRVSDAETFYVVSGCFFAVVALGVWFRYAWYFKESTLTIDDTQINWHRNGEDHVYALVEMTGVKVPNRIGRYYGISYLQLRFGSSQRLNLDQIAPSYEEIVDEIVARMKKYHHLQEFVAMIEAATH